MYHINSITCLSKQNHVQCLLVYSLPSELDVQSECFVVHSKNSVVHFLPLVSAEVPQENNLVIVCFNHEGEDNCI